jgi:hypothetical protein
MIWVPAFAGMSGIFYSGKITWRTAEGGILASIWALGAIARSIQRSTALNMTISDLRAPSLCGAAICGGNSAVQHDIQGWGLKSLG